VTDIFPRLLTVSLTCQLIPLRPARCSQPHECIFWKFHAVADQEYVQRLRSGPNGQNI